MKVATSKKAVTLLRMFVGLLANLAKLFSDFLHVGVKIYIQNELYPSRKNLFDQGVPDEGSSSGVMKKQKSQNTVHRVCVRCGQESYMRSRFCKADKAVWDCLYYNYVTKPKALAKKATKDQAGAIAAADAQAKEFLENCAVDGHAIKAMELWEENNITSRKYCKKATIAYGDFAKVFAVRVGKRAGRDEVPMEREQYVRELTNNRGWSRCIGQLDSETEEATSESQNRD
eukprot:3090528-Amphidinium_carterae.1